MRRVMLGVLVVALCAGMASGESIVGKKIQVEGGSQASAFVPISLAVTGEVSEKGVQVVDVKTKKAYPAMVREGNLSFVLDALPAKGQVTLTVVKSKAKTPQVTVTKKGDASELDVVVGGEPFTTYHYSMTIASRFCGRSIRKQDGHHARLADVGGRQDQDGSCATTSRSGPRSAR